MTVDQTSAPDLSLIVPAFNEEGNIAAFFEAVKGAVSTEDITCEVVFVDDGSRDNTFAVIEEVCGQNPATPQLAVKGISFSRNFGKESGMLAGLKESTGACCCFIDSDLQQRPETALEMYRLLINNPDYDCVAAYQEERSAGIRSKFSEKFYDLLGKSSGMKIISNASDFRVFRRNVAEALINMPESYRFTKGLFSWIGFKTLPYPYTPEERFSGDTTWSFRKLVSYAIDGVLSFSVLPLRLATYLGIVTSACAFIYLLIVVFQRLAFGTDIPGYATIVVLILLIGGVQLLVLGIIGEYLARVYIEGKRRPLYLVRRRVSNCDKV